MITFDDYIGIGDNNFVKYSNVVKNYKKFYQKKNIFCTFTVKIFNSAGEFTGIYMECGKSFFLKPNVRPYTIKFNPEILI